MLPVTEVIRKELKKQGRTQVWVANKMNEISKVPKMDTVKFNSIMTGKRKITGDELVALCKILGLSLEDFY